METAYLDCRIASVGVDVRASPVVQDELAAVLVDEVFHERRAVHASLHGVDDESFDRLVRQVQRRPLLAGLLGCYPSKRQPVIPASHRTIGTDGSENPGVSGNPTGKIIDAELKAYLVVADIPETIIMNLTIGTTTSFRA